MLLDEVFHESSNVTCGKECKRVLEGITHDRLRINEEKMSYKLSDIIGQEHIKEHLRVAITSGKISQAYLITGESMQGKEFIARIFANALVCEEPVGGIDPCGKCKACIVIRDGENVLVINAEDEEATKELYKEIISKK